MKSMSTSLLAAGLLTIATATQATSPPAPGQEWSPALTSERLQQLQFKRALIEPTRRAMLNRQSVLRDSISRSAARSLPYGVAVTGARSIPVLMATYAIHRVIRIQLRIFSENSSMARGRRAL